MGKRIFSTLILWVVVAAAIIFGKSAGWSVLIFILAAGSIKEVCDLLERLDYKPLRKVAQIANVAIFVSAYLGAYTEKLATTGGLFAFTTISVLIAASIVKRPYDEFAAKSVIPTILTLLAVSMSLQWLVVISFFGKSFNDYTGVVMAMWLVAAAKFSDVGAYVIGAAFGRKRMSPTISPNKTWEGAIGGVLSSAAISAVIFGFAAEILPVNKITIWEISLAGAIIGVIAIISDLLESVLKRRADIKDSGKFIPGIGGALDLSDSLLLTSPMGFIILSLIWK